MSIHSTAVRKDGIPALTDPRFVAPGHPNASYVTDTTRVVGIVHDGRALAIPLNVLWWHEVVNLSGGGKHIAVTYCPLTGSSLAFDRLPIGGNELRVSGLLYDNNLVMFNRAGDESLWAQMLGQAICGPAKGLTLPIVPTIETSFGEWRRLHPDTEVTSDDTGHARDYRLNPYEDYWRLDAPPLIEEVRADARRPPKELVLLVPEGDSGGVAVPFLSLPARERAVVSTVVGQSNVAVLWDGPSRTATAFFAFAESWPEGVERPSGFLTLEAVSDGYRDAETGSLWNLEGLAIEGPGTGARLKRHPRAFVAFWFAWAVLRPDLRILTPGA